MLYRPILITCSVFFALFFPFFATAAEIKIAAASNFVEPLEKLAALFQTQTEHHVLISGGSTGKLYTQIKNGAPFEIFLAADQAHPQRLENEGLAGSRFTYAVGKLVLWRAQTWGEEHPLAVLKKGNFNKLAIANPRLAPYGVAAQEVLENLALWTAVKDKVVQGENITQTFQFVASGNAELGFVALSQAQKPDKSINGSFWLPPQTFYTPLRQDAVLLLNGQGKIAVETFWKFLRSAEAKAVIQKYGYETP